MKLRFFRSVRYNDPMRSRRGFTLIEALIVIAIVAALSAYLFTTVSGTVRRARDTKRKAEISQAGKLLLRSCYVPDAGEGDYDLAEVLAERRAKSATFAETFPQTPRDSREDDPALSGYRYIVDEDIEKCAIYGNLENEEEPVTLTVSEPSPGGGIGVLQASTSGWNGTTKYFQSSN